MWINKICQIPSFISKILDICFFGVCVHVNAFGSGAEITCKLNFLGFIYTSEKSVALVLPTLDVILHNVQCPCMSISSRLFAVFTSVDDIITCTNYSLRTSAIWQ